jgi:uncharacterized membrane protein
LPDRGDDRRVPAAERTDGAIVVQTDISMGRSWGLATTLQLMSVLVYLGGVPTALAYICYFYDTQLSRTATSGTAATLVEPAVAVLLAAGLLGEHLSPAAWLGVPVLLLATLALAIDASWSKAFLPADPAFARRWRVSLGQIRCREGERTLRRYQSGVDRRPRGDTARKMTDLETRFV